MRIQFFVEGDLERRILPGFVDRWLYPRLSAPIEISTPIKLDGCGGFIKTIDKFAIRHLSESDSGDLAAAIGLLDLKGPEDHNFYPSNVISVQDRYIWGKTEIERRVNHPKFHMFFAVHEIEAWLFSQEEIFEEVVRKVLFKELLEPEEINFDSPPATYLEHTYDALVKKGIVSHSYRKTDRGIGLFNSLDPERAYAKCPYLRRMLDALLSVSKEAGL